MEQERLSVKGLAEKSGVSTPTVRRAVRGEETARLNTTSATAIAAAFGEPVGSINWPGGLSNRGRTAGPNTR